MFKIKEFLMGIKIKILKLKMEMEMRKIKMMLKIIRKKSKILKI